MPPLGGRAPLLPTLLLALLALLALPRPAAAVAPTADSAASGRGGLELEGGAPEAREPEAASSMRGAWLSQQGASRLCVFRQEPCRAEQLHAVLLLATLVAVLASVACAFAFFRKEDKGDQITPLCPALVSFDGDFEFRMPLEAGAETLAVTRRLDGAVFAKVSLDWPDPFRPSAGGVAASARVSNGKDHTLATVVARNVAMLGQGLALCRPDGARSEVFGFVLPDGPNRYYVSHRTGVHLLTLVGDFGSGLDIEGVSPVGSRVFWFKKDAEGCKGSVLQHFDAGLAICCILATHVHRRLTPPGPTAALSPADEAAGSSAAAAEPQPGASDETPLCRPKGAEAAAAEQAEAPAGPAEVSRTSVFPPAAEGATEGAAEGVAESPRDMLEEPPGEAAGASPEAPGSPAAGGAGPEVWVGRE